MVGCKTYIHVFRTTNCAPVSFPPPVPVETGARFVRNTYNLFLKLFALADGQTRAPMQHDPIRQAHFGALYTVPEEEEQSPATDPISDAGTALDHRSDLCTARQTRGRGSPARCRCGTNECNTHIGLTCVHPAQG